MRKRILLLSAILALAMWAFVETPAPGAGLAAYIPSGSLLVLEARDFGALLKDWNASREKPAWLASSNYAVFSRSRLFNYVPFTTFIGLGSLAFVLSMIFLYMFLTEN